MITLIRKAIPTDLDRLMEIFSIARRFMQTTGNPNQWINGYPQRELIAQEIEADHCYAVENESGIIIATFCFIQGPDPTYAYIEDGQWPNDRPYYVIHRLASDGTCPGIGKYCFDWCFQQFPCLRADTHADNKVMQHVLTKNGFTRCGIIYVSPPVLPIRKTEHSAYFDRMPGFMPGVSAFPGNFLYLCHAIQHNKLK